MKRNWGYALWMDERTVFGLIGWNFLGRSAGCRGYKSWNEGNEESEEDEGKRSSRRTKQVKEKTMNQTVHNLFNYSHHLFQLLYPLHPRHEHKQKKNCSEEDAPPCEPPPIVKALTSLGEKYEDRKKLGERDEKVEQVVGVVE